MQLREPLDVHFIDDRLVRRDLWAAVVAPGKGFVEHGPQRRELGVVALVEREVRLRIVQLVAEHLVGPAPLASDRLGVRIEKDFVRIEPMPFGRLIRSMNAVAVDLSRQHVRKIGVPDHVGLFAEVDALRFLLGVGTVEQAKLNLRRVLGIEGEIGPASVPGRPHWIRPPRPDARRHEQTSWDGAGLARAIRGPSPRRLHRESKPLARRGQHARRGESLLLAAAIELRCRATAPRRNASRRFWRLDQGAIMLGTVKSAFRLQQFG